MTIMKRALLLSGGMDSLSIAWWKKPELAITINYGQLAAEAEINASKKICQLLNIEHIVIEIDCHTLGSGDMAGSSANKYAPASDWWPFRNQLLLTLAAMKAVSLGVSELLIGAVKSDGSHVDGGVDFIKMIDGLLQIQEGAIRVSAPAIHMSTVELITCSGVPVSVLMWAHSCHKSNVACCNCRGCNKYYDVLTELGYELD